jgi:soluble lytic murein transglycosylase
MQLMPTTAEWLKEKYSLSIDATQLFDAETNIILGTCYLSYLLEKFDNSVPLALAAYNGGEGNVQKWLNNPEYSSDGKTLTYIPFEETRNYVKKVTTYYELYQKVYK